MLTLLAYLSPVVILAAALLGVLGNTRRPRVRGLKGLTRLGWGLVAVAVTSAAVSLLTVVVTAREMRASLEKQHRVRAVAYGDIREGVQHLKQVLTFACLMRYTTAPYFAKEPPRSVPYAHAENGGGWRISLQSQEAIRDLSVTLVTARTYINGPHIPSAVPYGTSVRPAMSILAEESSKASQQIQTALAIHSAAGLQPEVSEAASALLASPFLGHLMRLPESWAERSAMEETTLPEIVNLTIVDSGVGGGSKQDYLDLLRALDRLEVVVSRP